MRAGKLRRRLQLQRRTTSTDAEGRPQESWDTVTTIWASIEPLASQERLMAAQMGVTVTHQVGTRYRPDLASPTGHDLRFMEGLRVLEISSQPIDQEERHRELMVFCRELEQI